MTPFHKKHYKDLKVSQMATERWMGAEKISWTHGDDHWREWLSSDNCENKSRQENKTTKSLEQRFLPSGPAKPLV